MCVHRCRNRSCRADVNKMTATAASLSSGHILMAVFTSAAFHLSLLVAAGASKGVQELSSSVEKLNALKQLLNAEQV